MKIKLVLTALVLATTFTCKSQNSIKKQAKMNESKEVNMVKSHTVEIKKGELFLAITAYQMPNKEKLLQEYFSIVFPPASKHGFTPLGQLPIDKVAAGDYNSNELVGLFKWPSMASVEGFLKELPEERLVELRKPIWSEIKQHIVVPAEDITITFKDHKTYEVKMVWSKSALNNNKIVSNGGVVLVNNAIGGYEDLGNNKAPNHLLIIEWPNQKTADSFRMMNLLKFEKEEAFYTHFAFPEKQ